MTVHRLAGTISAVFIAVSCAAAADYPQSRGDADEQDMRAIIRRLAPLG